MIYSTLISATDLLPHLTDPDWLVVDCRFVLADPEQGRREYLEAHIPGAVYAHLDEDLSGPVVRAVTGRHPLPKVVRAAHVFGQFGIGPGVQVVAYDATGGALAAGRLWWMLHWLGHPAAAVLDGGWQRWNADSLPQQGGQENRAARVFTPVPQSQLLVTADQIDTMRQDPACLVLDARSGERFHGQNETIDPVAGHIPGAVSAPYQDNLYPDFTFRPVEELRQRYQAILGDVPAGRSAVYCGSGVSAAHDILAMLHAGMGKARLYAGSLSEWITDPSRPVSTED